MVSLVILTYWMEQTSFSDAELASKKEADAT